MKYIFISPLVPIKFAVDNYNFPDGKWGYPAYGDALQIDNDRLIPNRIVKPMFDKRTPSTIITIQLKRGRTGNMSEATNPSELWFYDYDTNEELGHINPTQTYTLAGDTHPDNGEQIYTEQYKFTHSVVPVLSGHNKFYCILRHYYSGTTTENYRSEPIWVKAKHDNHSLFEYHNTVNKEGVLFEQLSPRFSKLVPSNGMTDDDQIEHTVYPDQKQRVVELHSDAYKTFKWDIGGREGISGYDMECIANGLSCDTKRIDGRLYTMQEGGFERSGAEGKHVRWASATLRRAGDDAFSKGNVVETLWTRPASYPYALSPFVLTDGIHYIGFNTKVIDDATGETNYLNFINSLLSSEGLAGTAQVSSGVYTFTNAEGERYKLNYPIEVFKKMFTLSLNATNTNTEFSYLLGYPDYNRHAHVVCWGAASGDEELKSTYTASVAVRKTYATTGTKTVRVFHNDEATEFNSTKVVGNTTPRITNITGDMPNTLQTFRTLNHDFSGLPNLDISFLDPAIDTLRYLTIDNCGLVTIVSGWAQNHVSGTYKPWAKLKYIAIVNNNLTSSAVDSFINELYNYGRYTGGIGTLNLKGNIPSAPRTSASDAAVAKLQAAGWNVQTD